MSQRKMDRIYPDDTHETVIRFCKEEVMLMAIDRLNNRTPIVPTMVFLEAYEKQIRTPELRLKLPQPLDMELAKSVAREYEGDLVGVLVVYMGEYSDSMEIDAGDVSIFMPKVEVDVAMSQVNSSSSSEGSNKTLVGLLEFDGVQYTFLSAIAKNGLPGEVVVSKFPRLGNFGSLLWDDRPEYLH